MSTSVALAVVPKVIWDVNGYYRSLGIEWPYRPTRKQLRQGFFDHDGHSSDRLTYYMKQLLDPAIRAEYDAMPLGSRYRDRYVLEEDLRKLAQAAGEVSEDEGRIVTAQDLMEEYDKGRPQLDPLPPGKIIWNWGFYALNSRKFDTETLERWQELLVAEFAKNDVAITISIGYIGNTGEEHAHREHDDRQVFFLHEEVTPTQELAETAVSSFMAHRQKGKHD